jgi:hypothetical protein
VSTSFPYRKLLANIDKLKAEPYIRERMGEPATILPALIRRAFDHIPGQDQERMSADRRRFSAWMVSDIKSQRSMSRGTSLVP